MKITYSNKIKCNDGYFYKMAIIAIVDVDNIKDGIAFINDIKIENHKVMSEDTWTKLGLQMSLGWIHYFTNITTENMSLYFKKKDDESS